MAAMWHIARFNLNQKSARRAVENVPDKFKVKGSQWL